MAQVSLDVFGGEEGRTFCVASVTGDVQTWQVFFGPRTAHFRCDVRFALIALKHMLKELLGMLHWTGRVTYIEVMFMG